MKARWKDLLAVTAVVIAAALIFAGNRSGPRSAELLNVSYDPTRELFRDLNAQFVAGYAQRTGRTLTIHQSHGGSSRQARAVMDGLEADVVTLALSSDVDALSKRGLIAENWAGRLPHNSQPFTSTIVFVVRRGNPRGIRDWPDLVRPQVAVVLSDPRTSGSGKLSVLAAWGSVIYGGGSEQQAREYLRQLLERAPVLPVGARSAAATFTGERTGDVQLTWENEALREVRESKGDLQIVYPPVSIRAEPSVAWVDTNVRRHGTAEYAKAYLEFLYSDQAQAIIVRHGYRSLSPNALPQSEQLPRMELFPITVVAASWQDAQQKFFAENAIFDTVDRPRLKP
jgi:sulfate/thiosulfate transport system substrate-binding protein